MDIDDCGLFAIATAYDLCSSNDPVRNYVPKAIWDSIWSCALEEGLVTFPMQPQKGMLW